jgi:hypothetical protein
MINLNFQSDDGQINDFLFVCEKFNKRPNRLIIHESYKGIDFTKIINDFTFEQSEDNLFIELINSGDGFIKNQRILHQLSENMFISFLEIDKYNDDFAVSEVLFFFKDSEQLIEVENIIDKLSECILDLTSSESHKINFLTVRENTIDIEPLLTESNEDFENYYNDNVISQVNKLVKKFKKDESGISVIYGESGVGKTNLAKQICHKLHQVSIFIPSNLIDQSINNPDFKNFIKKYGKVLLIIDDCEFMSNNLFGKNNFFVQNVIQLVDGIFQDILQVQILLIFNTDNDEDIDESILNSNSFIDMIYVDSLKSDAATDLSQTLGHKKIYKSSVRLIDVIKNKKNSKKPGIGLT